MSAGPPGAGCSAGRPGRTGRAGASGIAISFCDWSEKVFLRDIEKLINKSIPVVKSHIYDVEMMHDQPALQSGSMASNERRSGGMGKRRGRGFSQRA